jgi:type IV pilus assembly protein PilE
MHINKGFTLTELMITVAVISIIAAIAIPSYMGHMSRVRRAEAVSALEMVALYEEKFMAQNGQYGTLTLVVNDLATVGLTNPNAEARRNYNIVATPNGNTFIATATGVNAQANDQDSNGVLIIPAINSNGERGRLIGGVLAPDARFWKTLRP